ncbi:PKD domain-containing protein [Actinomadura logoneensis]|uniref:PKD domain-containing protein n=1 Tax=Actinomadura logoneensis TaxID=2293572 RepID=A0A372JML3_9ACTN|nr:discoidin domain-containing protein [Actinomadura logoneensis]RFU41066.1 PKD domain-containing protein [Actinomadura logoneensis]
MGERVGSGWTRRPVALVAGMLAVVLGAALLTGASAAGAARAALPSGFRQHTVLSGLTAPTAVRFAPDGRVFVAEKSGIVKMFQSLTDTNPVVYADLRQQVFNGWDRGLLGLALHPDFPVDPRVYVLYTYNGALGGTFPRWPSANGSDDQCPDPPGANKDGCVVAGRISVLTPAVQAAGALASRADAGPVTEKVLLEDWCQQFPSHSVGTLQFGADGMLYAGAGDGASYTYADYGQTKNPCGDPPGKAGENLKAPSAEGGSLRAQDVLTPADPTGLDGAIIRVDPDTGKPAAGNPATTGDENAKRIIAHGFRNPYRFTIRPGTNEVWAGDVGLSTWEEIDRVPAPPTKVADFGWPCFEGNGHNPGYEAIGLNACQRLYGAGASAVVPPYFTYKHSEKVVPNETCGTGSSAISGTAFYDGTVYPQRYKGALFFTDYARKCVWAMRAGANGLPDPKSVETFDASAGAIVDLESGPGGDLFGVDVIGGRVVRWVYEGGNNPPVAAIKSDVTSGGLPLTVHLDASASSDADGDLPLAYDWDLDGDGTYGDSHDAAPTATFTKLGSYQVGLRVTDARGASDTATLRITAGSTPPVAKITQPAAGTTWQVGDRISFSGTGTDAEDGTLTGKALSWQIIMHHCPSTCHTHEITAQDGPSGSFVAPDHEYPSWLELRLTATDSSGITDVKSVELHPRTAKLTLASSPAGIPLTQGQRTANAPFTGTVIKGSVVSVAAPTGTRIVGGRAYEFVGWSDKGGAAHNVTVGKDTTLTATYRLKTNLALKRPVTASSVEQSWYPARSAVDGNPKTRWSSKRTDPQWLRVDLGSVRQVGYVILRWESAYATAFQVQVSRDGRTWTTVHARTNGNGGTDFVPFTPVQARYVRVYGTKRATAYGYSLWEMEVNNR